VNPKLTLTYGIRYEVYPAPYRDHTGASVLLPQLPQSANVEVGGINGNPRSAGIGAGWGQIVPRVGVAYRLNDKTVIRTGFGLTTDPDSMRYLRDSFPEDLAPSYQGTGNFTIAVRSGKRQCADEPYLRHPEHGQDGAQLLNRVRVASRRRVDEYGAAELPPRLHRKLEPGCAADLPAGFVGTIGYVGDHFVRQQVGVNYLNAANFPSFLRPACPTGSSALRRAIPGRAASRPTRPINIGAPCPVTATGTAQGTCYNTGGITVNLPLFSSGYDGLQTQLTRNAGKNASVGVVYTFSHAIDYEDNGAGSGSGGTARSTTRVCSASTAGRLASTKSTTCRCGASTACPSGPARCGSTTVLAGDIIGGWQLSGQFSHYSGFPFSVSANSNTIGGFAPGFGNTYAQLTGSYSRRAATPREALSP
jgi:hypothetical protein